MSDVSGNGSSKSKSGIPFGPKTLAEAWSVASRYTVIVEPSSEIGFLGSAFELPGVSADGPTQEKCAANTVEALVDVVATMLENGDVPPKPLPSIDARTEQVNFRVSPREKAAIRKIVRGLGYKGISDFIRTAVLDWISSHQAP